MYCQKCGNEMKEGEKFCARCGTSFVQENTSVEKKMSFALQLGVFLLPVVFSWLTLQKGYKTKDRVVSFIWLGISILVVYSKMTH